VKKLNHRQFNFKFVFANKYLHSNFYEKLINDSSLSSYNINYTIGNATECMKKSDISIMSSGTVALEAALINCNSIIVYKLNFLTYLYVKSKIISNFVALPNIILNKEVFPELIQGKMNADNVLKYINKILNDISYRDYQNNQCNLLQTQFSNATDTFNNCLEFIEL
jgi:lipid-A-disaccharide synthase